MDKIIRIISELISIIRRRFSSAKELHELEEVLDQLKGIKERVTDVAIPESLLQMWDRSMSSFESKTQVYKLRCERTKSLCANACSRYKLRSEVIKEVVKIKKLINQIYSFINHPSPVTTVHIRVMALGIEQRLKELQQCLKDEEQQITGICGPGGIGKTTILKALNNEFLRSSHGFDMVIYATASQDNSIGRLQAIIMKRLGLPWQKREGKETRAVRISMALEKKRFVLLLDDIWEPLNLEDLGIPLPNSKYKSKVLFTTRSRDVCINMGAMIFEVDQLGTEDAWQLFQIYAGQAASLPEIVNTAKILVKECEGLPLALLAVGRSMASVTSRERWTDSLATIKKLKQEFYNRRPQFPGMEPTVLAQLRFSYKNLHTEQLKLCTSYCSLYPKNHSILKETLIQYWIGERFIKDFHSIDEAHRTGERLIVDLKTLGMLENGDNPDLEVTIHDILYTILMEENKFFVQAGSRLMKVPKIKDCILVDKISLMYNDIKMLDGLPSCPRATTLILKWNQYLRELPHNLFKLLPALRVVDLSNTGIRSIPRELCSMVQLTHIDLSFTKIKFLPKEMGELVNLIQLFLEGTNYLTTIPRGIISKLFKLLSLNLYDSYGNWEVNSKQDDDEDSGAGIEELECLEHLSDLGITICNSQALERFSNSHALMKSTRYLIVNQCEDLNVVQLSSSLKRLQVVTISDCSTLQVIEIGVASDERQAIQDIQLKRLEILHLKALYRANIIWRGVRPHDFLPILRELDICFCHELTNISWIHQLVCLENISLDTCKKIEQVIGSVKDETNGRPQGLQKLRNITLQNLPHLKTICDHPLSLPSLEYIKVLQCPELRRLPLVTESASQGVIQGEIEWWNSLKWEEGATNTYTSFWYFQSTE